jgi:hypothetical protein
MYLVTRNCVVWRHDVGSGGVVTLGRWGKLGGSVLGCAQGVMDKPATSKMGRDTVVYGSS